MTNPMRHPGAPLWRMPREEMVPILRALEGKRIWLTFSLDGSLTHRAVYTGWLQTMVGPRPAHVVVTLNKPKTGKAYAVLLSRIIDAREVT